MVNWLFRKPSFSQNGICSAWSSNIMSPAPSSHLFPLAAGLYKTKLEPNEKNVCQIMPNYAKLILIFLNTFFWTIQPSGLLIETFHNTSCPLPTIEVAFFTSLSSFIEEPNTAQCLHGSAREAWPVSVFCAPLSCSPFTFTGVWCLCAKNSVHKRFLKPSQTMPANNLFWTNPMLSHGHYQLKLKYDLLYVKSCAKIQIDFEKRRARNSRPDTFRQILQIHTNPNSPKGSKMPKVGQFQTFPNQRYQFTEIDMSQHVSTCLNMSQHVSTCLNCHVPTWILPSARFLRHISR